jgi:hypothetical protein
VGQNAGCANVGETCTQGFYCGDSFGVPSCVPRVGLANLCDEGNTDFYKRVYCLESLRCVSGACIPQLDIGEVCTSSQDCLSGYCEPYAGKCAQDLRFAPGSTSCVALTGG